MRTHRLSGTQIVVIVVSLCAAVVAAPAGVMAAGSLVTITDPSTSYKARVTSKGSVLVSERDMVTGANARIDGSGRQLVNETPAAPFGSSGLSGGATVPAGKRMVVQTVSVEFTISTGGGAIAFVRYKNAAGGEGYLSVPTTVVGNQGGFDRRVGLAPVTLYAGPGQVYCEPSALSGNLGGAVFCHVSGYLVDA